MSGCAYRLSIEQTVRKKNKGKKVNHCISLYIAALRQLWRPPRSLFRGKQNARDGRVSVQQTRWLSPISSGVACNIKRFPMHSDRLHPSRLSKKHICASIKCQYLVQNKTVTHVIRSYLKQVKLVVSTVSVFMFVPCV